MSASSKRLLFFLDDDNDRHAFARTRWGALFDLVAARTFHEAKAIIESTGKFDLMMLDHDLGDYGPPGMYGARYEYTGQDVAKAIVALPVDKYPDRIVVHSWNPDGAKRMKETFDRAWIPCVLRPFEV